MYILAVIISETVFDLWKNTYSTITQQVAVSCMVFFVCFFSPYLKMLHVADWCDDQRCQIFTAILQAGVEVRVEFFIEAETRSTGRVFH